MPGWSVLGVPYNYMVPGFENGRVNTLRLWSARATRAFDLEIFNAGDYAQAVRAQTFAENISKVLYPEDSTPQGKELRLQQQYFFVACSLRDFLDQVLPQDFDLKNLPDRIVFQLNDTHPVIAIPELMRILVDERGWEWDDAWAITQKCFAYTCHTLLPEALEVWSVELLGKLLPRHLEIIYKINEDFMAELREATRTTSCACAACRSSPSTPSAPSAWPTWPRSRAPRSTAWPRCTRSCSRTRSCTTSPTTTRTSSPTSPTGSPRAASCGWPTRSCRS